MITTFELERFLQKSKELQSGHAYVNEYENLVLALFLIKYLSDIYKTRIDDISKMDVSEEDKPHLVKRITFDFKDEFSFDRLYAKINSINLLSLLRQALISLESSKQNYQRLYGIFRVLDFSHLISRINSFSISNVRQLLRLLNELDLCGNEDFDLFGYAFKFFYRWRFSFESFRNILRV